jgi:glutamate dehydrogenase (NAD(P)+)
VIASELAARGARVVAVADVAGGLHDPAGLDVAALLEHQRERRFLRGFDGARPISKTDVLEVECDVLIPAALECQITHENAGRLACSLVVEAANGPTTPEADSVLAARGIPVVPDILANGGGVTVSYYEWAQGVQREAWAADDVTRRLREGMRAATEAVLARDGDAAGWRTAAHVIAVERVAEAASMRAIYP